MEGEHVRNIVIDPNTGHRVKCEAGGYQGDNYHRSIVFVQQKVDLDIKVAEVLDAIKDMEI